MLNIKVHSAADAQAAFDAFCGRGVTWREPYTPRGWHQIIVLNCAYADAVALLDALRIRASVKEF